jgi:hypothetical protein
VRYGNGQDRPLGQANQAAAMVCGALFAPLGARPLPLGSGASIMARCSAAIGPQEI